VPRYKFDWSNLPVGLLVKLARFFELDGADLPSALREAFGARPREDFVREARPVLEEAWLAHDPGALAEVVHALWRPSRDGYVVPVDVRGQMEWLAERNTTGHLCQVVLAELVKAGEHPPPLFRMPVEPKVLPVSPANGGRDHQPETGHGPGRQPVPTPSSDDRDHYRPRPAVKTTGSPVGSAPALEVGQLVRARGQQWVVSALKRSSQPEDELAPARLPGRTMATLTSVSDDDLGEELTVVWEVEPGREILPVSDLPDAGSPPYDDPEVLGAFLDAVRWGTVASADTRTLQAPFRSGIRIEDYQLEPVARALAMPRVNLLIADDVGLGKTIEAGLIAQELLLRHRARRMVVVCPASLTNKWHGEMRDRFGLEFQILDAAALKELRRSHGLEANPFSVFPRTIISLQWLRTPRVQRLLDEVLGPATQYPGFFDLLVVDEAHHCAPPAPARGKGYAVDSKQTQAVARLGAHSTHRLFLSATPHNGYSESWQALLAMLDPQRFARGVEPDQRVVDQVVVRRLKASVTDAEGRPRFPARAPRAVEVAYTDDERRAHTLLGRYAAARRRQLLKGDGWARSKASDLVTLLLKKRLFSSPAAFAATLRAHMETLERPSGGRVPPARVPDEESAEEMGLSWLDDLEEMEEPEEGGAGQDQAEREMLDRAASFLEEPGEDGRRLLQELERWCARHAEPADSKAKALVEELERVCRPGGKWSDERVVVFTEYVDTLEWLAGVLYARGFGGDRVGVIHGGTDEKKRERLKAAFQASPHRDPIRVLLATDAAGEGIDLQAHCHRVVNYDIPFNPNRLEQRIGRVDRLGQRHEVEVTHFVGEGWQDAPPGSLEADLEFLYRVARKVATEREDLGPVNPVLAAAVEARMLGRDVSSDPTVPGASVSAASLRAERELRARSAREDIARLRAQLEESVSRLHVAPTNVARVVATGLALGGQPELVDLGDGTYEVPELRGGWERALEGLADPLNGERRLLAFDPSVAEGREDVVYAHLGHPLVAHCTRLLRSAIWGSRTGLRRATAVEVALPEDLDLRLERGGLLVVAFARLVVVGGDGARLHEEVLLAGRELPPPPARSRRVELDTHRYQGLRVAVEASLEPGACSPAPPSAQRRLAESWAEVAPQLAGDVGRRAEQTYEGLARAFGQRQADEARQVKATFDQLGRTLREALEGPGPLGPVQLSFADLGPAERQQLERDRRAWRERLEGLDAERDRELRALAARFAGARYLVFPCAVALCSPSRSARARRCGAGS
jgi:superfamily II DNA or RNA helicase